MIKFEHVGKTYPGGHIALRSASFEIERGEFVFVTGPSGAGKTTLLRLLLRQETATTGRILVNNRDIAAMPASKVPELRRSIGVVFQDFKLIRRRTALENVVYVLNVAGIPKSEQKRRAYHALKGVGLQHRINAMPEVLSGGEQQRVAVARAVVNDPELLLADEPTGNLDAGLAAEIMRLFREINSRGTTVVIATHDLELIRHTHKRAIHIGHGRAMDEVPS